jgi:hypothetical protein
MFVDSRAQLEDKNLSPQRHTLMVEEFNGCVFLFVFVFWSAWFFLSGIVGGMAILSYSFKLTGGGGLSQNDR